MKHEADINIQIMVTVKAIEADTQEILYKEELMGIYGSTMTLTPPPLGDRYEPLTGKQKITLLEDVTVEHYFRDLDASAPNPGEKEKEDS